ncbi:MAG TPA: flavin reductase family protein [Cytophagaceae bacterium]|nr:flavin reductase family protein [Cytophagaceae bacterium]
MIDANFRLIYVKDHLRISLTFDQTSPMHTIAKTYKKKDFPVHMIRRFLEPGPILLVSSCWRGKTNLMTMGWHTVLEFSPSLVGCMISSGSHSFDMIRKSRECVLNVPTTNLMRQVIGIGNVHGDKIDKFEKFHLTPQNGTYVHAPIVKECYANLECKLHDDRLVSKYNFFIFEVVKAHAPASPKYPETIHYTGDGVFMLSGKHVNYQKFFKKENL